MKTSAITLLAAALSGSPALSQTAQDTLHQSGVSDPIALTIGADYVSQYFFRGIIQEDDGFIIQPYADLTLTFVEREDWSLGVNLGVWNSVHSEDDTSGSTDDNSNNLYETDWYAGIVTSAHGFDLSLIYTSYTSPSNAFSTVDEILLGASYDDSENGLLFGLAVAPSIALAFEIGNAAADGGDNGIALELGIAPSWELDPEGDSGLTLSVPLTVGLSLSDYYEDADGDDDTFGYLDIGVDLSMPIFQDTQWGSASITAGLHALFLGDNAADYNDDDDTEFIASVGLAWDF